jgi:hypothetical protein
MSKQSIDGKSSGLRLHLGVGDQVGAVRSGSHTISLNSRSKRTGANSVKLPLGGGQALGRAGGELPGGPGLLLQQSQDILSGMLDIYLSSMSNRLNSIMKVLTIIATIFMPLTFITSLYGMNFKHMPELHWEYGYFMVLGMVVVIAVSMLEYFRRKQWI